MIQLQKLPIGEQDFETLRRENRLYIDKTELIYQMVQDGTYYFLSRPRRFGKSLLLSTIEAYFLGKRELFDGLYVSRVESDWGEHPVMHIDFSKQSYGSEQDLYDMLNLYLGRQEDIYGADSRETSLALRFAGVIERAYKRTGKGVVVLIDEYDKPLLQAINNPDKQDALREILRGFYGVLKGTNKYIRFVLLTGITKFSKISIFSDLNNLRDISRTKQFACLCGLTDEEVNTDLSPYIQRYAEEKEMSYAVVREQMRRMYDGYHFAADTPGLYNPFSIMNALWWGECRGYWFESGTPTVLAEMLKRQHYILDSIEGSVNVTALDNNSGSTDSIVPLLFQSGYLSINKISTDGRIAWLTFPNEEVRDGFFNFLLPYYSSIDGDDTHATIDAFVADVRLGNVEQFLRRLQASFADFQYDAQTTPESHFRNVLYILCKLIGLDVDAEYQTSDGRIDLLMRTDKYIYIVECKIDSTPQVALQQIKDKEYALPWTLDNRQKILIGLNFSTATRRPNGWIIEFEGGKVVEHTVEEIAESTLKGTLKSTLKGTAKSIVELLFDNPQLTISQVAEILHKNRRGIVKHFNNLKAQGLLRRVGPDKGGHWEIISEK